MADLRPVAGSKLYIGTRVARKTTLALADFADQEGNWVEVTGWTSAGSLGDTVNSITQSVIDYDRDLMAKGTRAGGTMENTFLPDYADAGQLAMKAAEDDCSNYAFKVEWGAGCVIEGEVTITVADPGVVTFPGGHGLEAGAPVMFTPTGGDLPTGLTPDTVYYVVDDSNLTATTFAVAATPGGDAIETTGAATATAITATAQPAGETDMFYGLVMPGSKNGGEANTARLRTWSIAVNSNIVEV
jgi:hypothetical protein|tara:strand:+ start:30585 stop:31316 length:732 start_codon:yes stop_codon:yes gene_type:complete